MRLYEKCLPHLYALPVTLCILCYGYVNYKHPKVEHIDITSEKNHDFSPIRIVAISDVHLGHGTGVSALKGYVELINSHNPDLILIAGDLIDNSVQPLLHEPYAEILSTLEASMGIYMVPGNHEYISGLSLWGPPFRIGTSSDMAVIRII